APAMSSAIHRAQQGENNRANDGAYLIALGLLRDRSAVPAMLEALSGAKNSLTRAAAAEGLVLVGPDVARPAVRARLLSDPCYWVRSTYADILGTIGDAADAPLLLQALRDEPHPETRGRLAAALGMLDSPAGTRSL